MKQNESKVNWWLKANYKGISIVVVMAVASILINIYIGFGPPSPQSQSFLNNNISSNTKANPFVMRGSFNLKIMMDNKPLSIPSQIGIEPALWQNHTLDRYGSVGKSMNGMMIVGMAPLYTNDNSGLIKIGSTVVRNYTLGDFLNIWGLNLNGKNVNATINGKPLTDFRNYVIKDNDNIFLNISNKTK